MIQDIKSRIKTLPPLPESFKKIEAACEKEDGGIDDIARAIESDPMVVADILKTANSPLYGFNRQIKAVLQAVSLFGKVMTKSLVMSSTIKGLLKIDVSPYAVSPEQFVNISAIQGAIAKNWFKKISPRHVDDIFLCAILQDTGKIVLSDEIIRQDEVALFKSDVLSSFLVKDVEMEYFGTTSILFTADIFEYWRFEPSIVNYIKYSDDPENAPDEYKLVSSALLIIRTLTNYKDVLGDNSIEMGMNLAKKFGFDEDVLSEVIEDMKSKH